MFCAMQFIQARMSPLDTAERAQLSDAEFEAVKAADLNVLITPYVIVGLVILALFFLIFFTKNAYRQTTFGSSFQYTLTV